jgi:hypothetical protein
MCAALVTPRVSPAAWETRARTADDRPGANPVAYAEIEGGYRTQIFLDTEQNIYLTVILGNGVESFAQTSCATFQIDDRKPMHFFNAGDGCIVEDRAITYLLGQIENHQFKSLIMHRLMNGSRLAFRFTTKNGRYREIVFPLQRSKQALKQAIGFDTRVSAD